MASFLNGLMGALKGFGGEIGDGINAAGRGLMGVIDPATAAAPEGGARAPGSGGLMPAAADFLAKDTGKFTAYTDPRLDDPITRQTGVTQMQRMPTLEAQAKPSFMQRIRTADPETGLSTIDKFERVGAAMRDEDSDEQIAAVDARGKGRVAEQAKRALAAQIDQLFPDDPQMRFLLKANPEKATEAMATVYQKNQEPANVGAGDTRVWDGGDRTYTAPRYGVEDGVAYGVDDEGFRWGPQRQRTWAEIEDERAARASEETARGQLGVSRDRLNFDRTRPRGGAGGGAAAPALPPLPPGFRPVR